MLTRHFLIWGALCSYASGCSDDSTTGSDDDDAGASRPDDGSDDDGSDDDASSGDDDVTNDDASSGDDDSSDDDSSDDDASSGDDDVADDDRSDDDAILDSGVTAPPDAGPTSPGALGEPPYGGGSRLRALAYQGPDGAQSYAGYFYGTELDTRCNFVRTGSDDDGPIFHCIAAEGTFARFDASDCSTPIAPEPSCPVENLVYRVLRPVQVGCAAEQTFYELGESVGQPELFEVSTATLACESVGVTSSDHFALLPFDPSKYVEGRQEIVPIDAGRDFGARFVVGGDGSYLFDTLVVDEQGCYLDSTDSNVSEGYCVPGGVYAFAEQYPDSACGEERVVGQTEPSCREFVPPELVKSYVPDARGCSRLSSVHGLGPELAPQPSTS
jgi:hypothetical protein